MARTTREEWRAGWPIPVVGLIGTAGSALMTASAGVFMGIASSRFGWDRTTFSSGLTVMILVGVILMPIFGRIIDRVDLRKIALVGVAMHTLAVASLGLLTGSIMQWIVSCALLAICGQLVATTVWATATARCFVASRGLALAVTLSGVGFSTASLPLLATIYFENFGPQWTYPLLALTWGGISFPLVLFLFHPAEAIAPPSEEVVVAEGTSYHEAITSRSFILLCAAGALFSLITYAMVVHLVPILRSNGLSPAAAAAILGLFGISAMVGRIVGGALLDRFPARVVGTIAFLLPVFAVAILLVAGKSIWLSAFVAIAFGLANGAEVDLLSYLIARYFGMKNFGGIVGLCIAFNGGASALGPLVAGILYDYTGNYDAFLLVAMVPMAIGALLIACLPRPRPIETEAPQDAAAAYS